MTIFDLEQTRKTCDDPDREACKDFTPRDL